MTTILAIKNPLMMFADSLCNDGDMKRLTKNKIQKIHIPYDGDSLIYEFITGTPGLSTEGIQALVGCSGETQSNAEFYSWCKEGLNKHARPRFSSEHGINGLLLLQNGILLRFDHQCFPFEIEDDYYAVGAGRDYVMGALEAYQDKSIGNFQFDSEVMRRTLCHAAMLIAAKLSLYTCEPIHILTLDV